MGRALDPHFVLDFTRSQRANEGSIELPEGDTEYHLRGRGESAPSVVELRWSARLRERLEALRAHAEEGDVGEDAARVGRLLAEFIEAPAWSAVAPQVAERGGREPLFLTVRSNASELYLLPWELLSVGAVTHVGSLSKLLLRYEWPDTRTAPRLGGLSQTRRGRVVFAWSAAGGKVDAARHVKLLEASVDAAAGSFDDRDRALDVVADASCASIKRCLDEARRAGDPVAVLHLLCHGQGDGGTFGLALGDDEGGVDVVSPSRLRMVLEEYAGLVRLVVIAACDGGNAGEVGAHLGSVAQEVHKAGFGAVIASRFPLSWKGAWVFASELYAAALGRGEPLEVAFLRARAELKQLPTYDWASLQLYARASDGDATHVFNARPYRGLAAFAPEHARFFFGRDAEVDELLRDLDALVARDLPRLLVVSGASGTGKSSMVLGGAIPRWQGAYANGGFAHLVVRPGASPAAALAEVRVALKLTRSACRRFVVVVDQFEEVFTHRDAQGALALARGLWELASEPASPLCVIVTMRVDFLARCNELVLDESGLRFDKIACDSTHQVLVAQMSPEQLVEAIEGPARAAGIALEPGLAREIVRDVEAAPGALPLMSHALSLLWARRDGPAITRAAYERLGSVHGALDEHAESQLAALRDDGARAVARRLMLALVHAGVGGAPDTRRRRAVDELAVMFAGDRGRFEQVLRRLVDARLLVAGGEAGAQTVEVAHEALIRSWKTYKAWIDADRTRLARLAQLDAWARDWRSNHDAVLHGSRLGYAEEVEKEGADDLSVDVRALLEASREARRRALEAAERSRRVRRALVAAAFATVSAFGAAGFALWRRAEAAKHAAESARAAALRNERAAIESEALSRASELRSLSTIAGSDEENLAAAIELRQDVVRRLGSSTASVDGALFQVVATAVRRPSLHADLDGATFALSPDGARVAAATREAAYLWSTRDGRLIATCASDEQGYVERTRPTFTSDGARMVVGFHNATACSVSARDGGGAVTLGTSDRMSPSDSTSQTTHELVIASDGALALTDNVVRSTLDGSEVLSLPRGTPRVLDLRRERGGGVLTVSADRSIRRWGVASRAPEAVVLRDRRRGELAAARFSPDASQVVTLDCPGGGIAVWGVADGSRRLELAGECDVEPSFSPDGRFIVARRTSEPTIAGRGDRRWESASGRLIGGESQTRVLGFTPDGSRAVELEVGSNAVVMRELASGRATQLANPSAGTVRSAWFEDGRASFAITSPHGETFLLNDGDGDALRSWGTALAPCRGLTFTGDGARALVLCDGQVVLRDLRDGRAVTTLRDVPPESTTLYVSNDARHALTTTGDPLTRLWDLSTGATRASVGAASAVDSDVLVGGDGPTALTRLDPVSFSPDAPLAAVRRTGANRFDPAELDVWDLSEGRVARTIRSADAQGVKLARFGPGGVLFAVMGDDSLRVFDANTGALTRSTPADDGDVPLDIAISPDGARAFTAHERDTLRVWNGRTGALERTTRIASNHISEGTFSDDGRYLFTLSHDHAARVWEVPSGRLLGTLSRDVGAPATSAFSPDGSRLATGYGDGSVALWQTRDARLLSVISAHLGSIAGLSFSRDGGRLATSGYDSAVRVWNLSPAELTRVACERLRGTAQWSSRPSLQRACTTSR